MKLANNFILIALCALSLASSFVEADHVCPEEEALTPIMYSGINEKEFEQTSRVNNRRKVRIDGLTVLPDAQPPSYNHCNVIVQVDYTLVRRRFRNWHYTMNARVTFEWEAEVNGIFVDPDFPSFCMTGLHWTQGSTSYLSHVQRLILLEPCVFVDYSTRRLLLRGSQPSGDVGLHGRLPAAANATMTRVLGSATSASGDGLDSSLGEFAEDVHGKAGEANE